MHNTEIIQQERMKKVLMKGLMIPRVALIAGASHFSIDRRVSF